jgi:hypothetical protein
MGLTHQTDGILQSLREQEQTVPLRGQGVGCRRATPLRPCRRLFLRPRPGRAFLISLRGLVQRGPARPLRYGGDLLDQRPCCKIAPVDLLQAGSGKSVVAQVA